MGFDQPTKVHFSRLTDDGMLIVELGTERDIYGMQNDTNRIVEWLAEPKKKC